MSTKANALNAGTTGLQAFDGTATFNGRTITAGTANVTIANGSGAAGDPTISVTGGVNVNNLTFITSTNASVSSSIAFTGLVSTYTAYRIYLQHVILSAATGVLQMQFGTGATPTYLTANYDSCTYTYSSSTANAVSAGTSITLNRTPAAAVTLTGYVDVFFPNNANFWPTESSNLNVVAGTASGLSALSFGSYTAAQAAFTAVKFFPDSGTITSGTFALYGSS